MDKSFGLWRIVSMGVETLTLMMMLLMTKNTGGIETNSKQNHQYRGIITEVVNIFLTGGIKNIHAIGIKEFDS